MAIRRRAGLLAISALAGTQLFFLAAQPVLATGNCGVSLTGPQVVKQWTSPYTYYYQLQAYGNVTCYRYVGMEAELQVIDGAGRQLAYAHSYCTSSYCAPLNLTYYKNCLNTSTASYLLRGHYKDTVGGPGDPSGGFGYTPWETSGWKSLACRV